MVKKNTQLKAVEAGEVRTWEECMNRAGKELAVATFHPQTPEATKSALKSLIVNIISNESGYDWISDPEAVAFLLPRYLNHMPEGYAKGIVHAAFEMAYDACPKGVERDARREAADV